MPEFDIHPEALAQLERLAKRKKLTPNEFARRVVLEYLEDAHDLAIARRRWADVVAGRTKLIPLSEILKKNGIGDRVRKTRKKATRIVGLPGKKSNSSISARKARAA